MELLASNLDQKMQLQSNFEESLREDVSRTLEGKSMQQFRSKAVEDALAPLIEQVTSLSVYRPDLLTEDPMLSKRRLGKPYKVSKLVQLVDKATRNFIAVGEEIASENPEFQEELLLACEEIQTSGDAMYQAATHFARDTCQSESRAQMVQAARELLLSVTRLMIVADVVDVDKLLKASSRIEEKLKSLREASSEAELLDRIRDCASDITYITQVATLRQNDMKSEASLQLLAAAQADLNQASRMLVSASKAFLQHSNVKSAEENHDYVITRMLDSLRTLSLLADGEDPCNIDYGIGKATPGELAMAFTEFEMALDQSVLSVPSYASNSADQILNLQSGLDKILSAAAELASSPCTRDYHQHAIITQCGNLKDNFQQLVLALKDRHDERNLATDKGDSQQEEGMWSHAHGRERERLTAISEHVTDMGEITSQLKRQFCRATIDHVSDAFIDALSPMFLLNEAAEKGDQYLVEKRAEAFTEHANNMQKAAMLTCSISRDVEGIQMVKLAAKYVRTLLPQVISAARTLALKPVSHVSLKNMSVFRETWVENVLLLTDAMDAIAPLLDFMSVTETHICEDGRDFLQAVENCDSQTMKESVKLISGRSKRLVHIITTETRENPARYSDDQKHQIKGAVQKLEGKSLRWFNDIANRAIDTLDSTHNAKLVDTKSLEEATQKVVDDVRDVRRSILITRTADELEGVESDLEDMIRPPRPITPTPSLLSQISIGSAGSLSSLSGHSTPGKFQRTPRHSAVFDSKDTAKADLAQLPAEQQAKLAKVSEGLIEQQAKFEKESRDWDDSSDIVVLAKEICMMMMDMSDFTRGLGPLRTTMDVMVTAGDIVRAAEQLDAQARMIANQCPVEKCRNDLHAYVNKMKLHSHQLKIIKVDTKTSTNDAVDNASTLIAAAKNLMTAVVETVKACYIAATAIARIGGTMPDQFIQWRLTLPRKKKLVSDSSAVIPEHSPRMDTPIHQLGQFKPGRLIERQPSYIT